MKPGSYILYSIHIHQAYEYHICRLNTLKPLSWLKESKPSSSRRSSLSSASSSFLKPQLSLAFQTVFGFFWWFLSTGRSVLYKTVLPASRMMMSLISSPARNRKSPLSWNPDRQPTFKMDQNDIIFEKHGKAPKTKKRTPQDTARPNYRTKPCTRSEVLDTSCMPSHPYCHAIENQQPADLAHCMCLRP